MWNVRVKWRSRFTLARKRRGKNAVMRVHARTFPRSAVTLKENVPPRVYGD